MSLEVIYFEATPELGAVIEYVVANDAKQRSRNVVLEDLVWRSKMIRDAAREIGIKRTPRRGRGRPANDE